MHECGLGMNKAWYTAEERAGRPRTRIPSLVPSIFGTQSAPNCHLYASQTNHFLYFASLLLDEYNEKVPEYDTWRAGLDSPLDILELIHLMGAREPTEDEAMEFMETAKRHVDTCKRLAIAPKPKHHMMLEMASRCKLFTGVGSRNESKVIGLV